MSLSKVRIRLLRRIAQATPATSATSPTTPGTTTANADPSPSASSLFPTLRVGFNSRRTRIIDNLVKMLSNTVNTATGGQYNLQNLKNNGFTFDPSQFPSPDQKNLVVFFKKVYDTLLNGGAAFKTDVKAPQLNTMIQSLEQASELNNLTDVNPSGPISQSTPTSIRSFLASLQPTVPTRRA